MTTHAMRAKEHENSASTSNNEGNFGASTGPVFKRKRPTDAHIETMRTLCKTGMSYKRIQDVSGWSLSRKVTRPKSQTEGERSDLAPSGPVRHQVLGIDRRRC